MGADADSVDVSNRSSSSSPGPDSGESGSASQATIHIRCSNGSKFSVQTALDATVGAFKGVLAGSCDVPADRQRLIYKGRILKDDQTLASYGVATDHTIHLVRGVSSATTPTTTAATNAGVPRTSNNSSTIGLGGSIFPSLGVGGLGGNGPSGITGIPELDQMQQQLGQNPSMLREIMNLPAIQNLMNNPELIRSVFMNNPQMREIIDHNPDLAHVLNDPNTLRQTLEAARNPELMREMMRNTDRAMSNIESSPEGFNMLRRMYETVQEPFLNAATMRGDLGGDTGSNPFAALLGNQGTGQARDRSSNSTTSSEVGDGSPAPNTNPLPNPWGGNAAGAQTANSRSNPGNDSHAPGMAGLGGLDLPDLEQLMGGMLDPSLFSQVMQNPAMMRMTQSLLSDPQYLNQIFNSNPNMRNLLESNTHLREMMQNPEFIRRLMSPETMQQLLTLQQTLFSQNGRQQSRPDQNQADGTTANNSGLDFLMNMLGGLGTGGLGNPNPSNVPPEELYATQLSQLQEMGFFDTQENIRALTATAGNVHAAVDRILGNLGQ